jgi:xanthine/uracil permease
MNSQDEINSKKMIPLSLQHVLAMFVGTIVPPLLIANAVGMDGPGTTILIQAALFASAIATLIQLTPVPFFTKKTGSNLPMMMGMSYVFLGVGISVAAQYGLAALFGGLLAASVIGVGMGFFVEKIKKSFTPLISGILVLCMGIGLYNPAINNLAGGYGSSSYGEPKNFAIGLFVALLIIFLIKKGKGVVKDSAILIGINTGYLISLPLGMVDFSQVAGAKWFSLPKPMAYGLDFNPGVIMIFVIAYAIGIIDFMGCCTVTTLGGYNRDCYNLRWL